jgi:membrane-associated phospholipid phosphatase
MAKRYNIFIAAVFLILIALTLAGAFLDLEIAKAVYFGEGFSENSFGVIFAFVGIIPTFVGWSFLGASIFYLSKKYIEDTRKRRWLKAFAVILITLSFFYFCNTLYLSNENAFKVHFAVAYSIGIAVICAASYLGYRLSKKSDDSELLKKAMFLAVVSLLTLIIISASKELMCRPRFRFVLAMDDTDYFINWWQSGRDIKASLGINIVTDEFASLPSGHSAYSLFAIFIFPTLADYVCFLKKFKPYLLALGFIWWAVTAFSRMTIGAHYLTDVTIAGLVTIVAYVIVAAIYNVHNIKRSGVLSLFSYHKT